MANGLGRVPVQPEVAAGNGEVGSDGHFLFGPRPEQGAVIANSQPHAAASRLCRTAAYLAEEGQFAPPTAAQGIGSLRSHFLRIGQKS
jgi:hypothetical protein